MQSQILPRKHCFSADDAIGATEESKKGFRRDGERGFSAYKPSDQGRHARVAGSSKVSKKKIVDDDALICARVPRRRAAAFSQFNQSPRPAVAAARLRRAPAKILSRIWTEKIELIHSAFMSVCKNSANVYIFIFS